MLFLFSQEFINLLNGHSNLLLVVLGVISIFYIRKEYFLKQRPFVTTEIIFEKKEEGWFFYAMLVNKGSYAGIAKINKALLKIGDEEYPTSFNIDMVLSPNERLKLAPIGNINQTGINKIRGHEFRINRVEIVLEVLSKSVGDKKFKFKTYSEFLIDVSKDDPLITIISERLN